MIPQLETKIKPSKKFTKLLDKEIVSEPSEKEKSGEIVSLDAFRDKK